MIIVTSSISQVTNAQTWQEIARRLPSDISAGEYFGHSVAVSGDYAFVGTVYDGSVYIYLRDLGGTENWGLLKKITSSDYQAQDRFGYALSVSGDILVVGASHEDTKATDAGAVYVFYKDEGGAGNWGEVKKIIPSDGRFNDCFGRYLEISGNLLIVGSPYNDYDVNNQNWVDDAGAAYIYEKDRGGADNWGIVKKITAPSNNRDAGDYFGGNCCIESSNIFVGVDSEDTDEDDLNIKTNPGAVYIYSQNLGGDDNWGLFKKLVASDRDDNDGFGYDISIDNGLLTVGAPCGSNGKSGFVYILKKDAGGVDNWGEVKKITASDAAATDRFGLSISLSGDNLIVGAYQEDEDAGGANPIADAGSAYIFNKDQGGINNWGQVQKIVASNREASGQFGYRVTINGSDIWIGAAHKSANTGYAYAFNSTNQSPVAGFGNTLSFDGTDDEYISVANPSAFNFGATDFTMEFWAKIVSDGTYHRLLFKSSDVDSWVTQGKQLYIGDDNKIYFDSNGDGTLPSNTAITTGRWTHIAASFNNASNTVKIYINGVLDKTGIISLNNDNAGHIMAIGHHFDGNIDECRIWYQELTQTQIQNWMYREVDITHPAYSNLKLYYKLNEGSGTTATDIDGADNNGTLINMEAGDWVDSTIRGWYTDEGTAFNGKLVGSDVEGSSSDGSDWDLTFQIETQPTKGSVTITSDNNFTYTPYENNTGDDSFTYKVKDGNDDWSAANTTNVTIANTSDSPVAGFGNALKFDGTDEYVNVANPSTLDFGSNDFTVEFWVKFDVTGHYHDLFRKSTSLVNPGGWVNLGKKLEVDDNDYLKFDACDIGIVTSNSKIIADKWTHLCVTYNKTSHDVKIYFDGVLDKSGTLNLLADNPAHLLAIAPWVDGTLDECRIWYQELSETQIQNWMYREVDNTHPAFGNLVLYYNMNEGSGTTATDKAGANNNGTLTNMEVPDDWTASDVRDWTTNEETVLNGKLTGSDVDGSSTDGADWNLTFDIVTPPTKGNVTIPSDNNFTFTPDVNKTGSDSFTYRVSDGSEWSNTHTLNLSISNVNDPPTGGSDTVTTDQNFSITFATGDFTYNDVENTAFDGIQITQVESAGDLEYNGTDVAISTDCPDVTKLVFIPEANKSATPYATFKFKVREVGGTLSISDYTMTINVNHTNGPPEVVINTGLTVIEGQSQTLNDLILKSIDDNDPESSLKYILFDLPQKGSLQYNQHFLKSDGINSITSFTQNDIANEQISYTHNSEENISDFFTFKVADSEGDSTALHTFSITVNNINDPPEIIGLPHIVIKEDLPASIAISELLELVTDPDDPDSTLTVSLICTDSNLEITQSEGYCQVCGCENWFGISQLCFRVSDGENTVDSLFTISVESVNDKPVLNVLTSEISFINTENYELELLGCGSDIETPDSLLVYGFDIESDSVHFNFNHDTCVLTLSANNNYAGSTNLTITLFDRDGGGIQHQISVTVTTDPTGINDLNGIPAEYELAQNYPNPFNPTTVIRYGIPSSVMLNSVQHLNGQTPDQARSDNTQVTLRVYDILGNQVATLQNGTQSPGYYERTWNAGNVSSGIYFYMLDAGSFRDVKKMILIK